MGLGDIINRQILCSTNKEVDFYNDQILNLLSGPKISLLSGNRLSDNSGVGMTNNYTIDILERYNFRSLPCHKIDVKVGCPLVILRNYDTFNGIVNGTRGVLLSATPSLLQIKVLSGKSSGRVILLPKMELSPAESALPFTLIRTQFPVRVNFRRLFISRKVRLMNM